MHTRHWIFGIGIPATLAAIGIASGFATPEEIEVGQANQQQFAMWGALVVQVAIGVLDWVKNNGKPATTSVVKTDVKTETSTPTTTPT